MPGHLGPLGDGAIIRLVGVEPHVLPDLLFLREFLQRCDLVHLVQEVFPLPSATWCSFAPWLSWTHQLHL